MKLFFFDLETTHVAFWKGGIHQIAGAIEIDGKVVQHFEFKVQPNPAALIEDEALAVSNVTRAELDFYPDMKLVYGEIIKMLGTYVDKFNKTDKFFLVGYNNCSFDNPFLRAFFVQNGDQYFGSWFWSSTIDVMVLAAEYLKLERHKMPNFQQSTVAKQLGIVVDETRLHDAKYDVEVLMEIYKYVSLPV